MAKKMRDVLSNGGFDLPNHPNSQVGCFVDLGGTEVRIGNGFIEAVVGFAPLPALRKLCNRLTGEELSVKTLQEAFFSSEGGALLSSQMTFRGVKHEATPARAAVWLILESQGVQCQVGYEVRKGEHFLRKRVKVSFSTFTAGLLEVVVLDVDLEDGEAHFYHYGTYCDAGFIRQKRGGFFTCLETPCYHTLAKGARLRHSFSLGRAPQGEYEAFPLVIGVFAFEGKEREGLDEGEREWFREYVSAICPVRQSPHIRVNGWCHGGINFDANLSRLLPVLRAIGVEHVMFQETLGNLLNQRERFEETALRLKEHGLGMGTYVVAGEELYLHGILERPANTRWLSLENKKWPLSYACFASEYMEVLQAKAEEIVGTGLLTLYDLDSFYVLPCWNRRHQHLAGEGSIQEQFQRIIQHIDCLRSLRSTIFVAGYIGFWSAGPHLARVLDAVHLTDDDFPAVLPDIHYDRLYADEVRRYWRHTHTNNVLPAHRIRFCIGHYGPYQKATSTKDFTPGASPESPSKRAPHHDSRGWRYSLLSALALGQNFDFSYIDPEMPQEDIDFARRWIDWARERNEVLRTVRTLFEGPGLGKIEGYAHIVGNHGYLFFFNHNYQAKGASLTIDLLADLLAIREIYPEQRLLVGPSEGLFGRGAVLPLCLPGKSVTVLEIAPASPRDLEGKLLGTPGGIVGEAKEGSRALLSAPVGALRKVGWVRGEKFFSQEIQFPGEGVERLLAQWEGQTKGKLDCSCWFRVPIWVAEQFRDPGREEIDWRIYPWAVNRLYLVLIFENPLFDEVEPDPRDWIIRPIEDLEIEADLNGRPTPVHAFRQIPGSDTAPICCYFLDASEWARFGADNELCLRCADLRGMRFSGGYLENVEERYVEVEVELED
jgi:hypothetical protein